MMEAELAEVRRAGGPPMRLRKSPAQFPRASDKRPSGQMARFTVFQLPGTQNENNAKAISAVDPSPATIISTVNRRPSS